MENEPQKSFELAKAMSESWSHWLLGAGAVAAVATGAVIKHKHEEKTHAKTEFIEQLSILNDPEELPENLQEDSDSALRDMNHMAALVLHYKKLSHYAWQTKSKLSRGRFETLKRVIVSRPLTLQSKNNSKNTAENKHPRYSPRPVLVYASQNLDEYPLLQQELAGLQKADDLEKALS